MPARTRLGDSSVPPLYLFVYGGVLAPRRLASPQSLSCAIQHVYSLVPQRRRRLLFLSIPPNTNKYKGGTLESPSRVRAGTAKGRSPQQTCVGWNRRRVEALGNAPPLRPCETPELMEKQAAYRRSQHGALRSRSPRRQRSLLGQQRHFHSSAWFDIRHEHSQQEPSETPACGVG